jgi:hypothetical protein
MVCGQRRTRSVRPYYPGFCYRIPRRTACKTNETVFKCVRATILALTMFSRPILIVVLRIHCWLPALWNYEVHCQWPVSGVAHSASCVEMGLPLLQFALLNSVPHVPLSLVTILGSCGCQFPYSVDKQGSVTGRDWGLTNLVETVFGILSEGVKGRGPKLTTHLDL